MTASQKIYTALCVGFAVLLVIGNLTYQKFVVLAIPGIYNFELSEPQKLNVENNPEITYKTNRKSAVALRLAVRWL